MEFGEREIYIFMEHLRGSYLKALETWVGQVTVWDVSPVKRLVRSPPMHLKLKCLGVSEPCLALNKHLDAYQCGE